MLSEIDQVRSDEAAIAGVIKKHFDNITKKLIKNLIKQKLKQRSLHCQKHWIGTKTTKALLNSDLNWMTERIHSHSNLTRRQKY